jgi:hypothetical protein
MMDEISKINVGDYEKQADGSWVSVKNSSVNTKGGKVLTIPPGMIFRIGFPQFGGIDFVKALDEISVT